MIYVIRIFLLIVIISGCNPKPKFENTSISNIYVIPTDSIISLTYTITTERNGFKFDDRNNNKKYLAEFDGYDLNNNLIVHSRFNPDGFMDEQIIYIYQDEQIKEEYRLERGSSETLYKTTFVYQSDGKLSSTVKYNFQRRIKKDVHKSFGSPGGCVILQSDFENRKSWGGKTIEDFTYDSKGNLIEKKTTSENSPMESKTYTYDSLGKIKEENTLRDNYLTRKITTTHFNDSIVTYCQFGNDSGPILRTKYDKNKNILLEQDIDSETGKQVT